MDDKPKAEQKSPVARTWMDSDQFRILPFFIGVVSLGVSIYTGHWHWFGRSGSLIAIGGLLQSSRAILRQSMWDEMNVDFGRITREELTERESANRLSDLAAAQFGLYHALFGTVIWGYGDLIGSLLARLR